VNKLKSPDKPFDIPKTEVWEAWLKVKANKGAPGVDGCTLEEFEKDLKGNLYKIWNRMSSGSYFPPAVRAVEIPKPHGTGTRVLGVPTVADRIANRGGYLAGKGGGTGVSPRLLRVSPGALGVGRGGDMPTTVLAVELGGGFRHRKVLRQRAVGPADQGGETPHRSGLGGAVCQPLAGRTHPAGGRVLPSPGPWYSPRICGYASNAMGNFCFDVTLSYRRLERPRRVTKDM
jgi:hypothetical protein